MVWAVVRRAHTGCWAEELPNTPPIMRLGLNRPQTNIWDGRWDRSDASRALCELAIDHHFYPRLSSEERGLSGSQG